MWKGRVCLVANAMSGDRMWKYAQCADFSNVLTTNVGTSPRFAATQGYVLYPGATGAVQWVAKRTNRNSDSGSQRGISYLERVSASAVMRMESFVGFNGYITMDFWTCDGGVAPQRKADGFGFGFGTC